MAFGPVNPTFVWQVEAGICHVKVVFLCVFCHSFFFFSFSFENFFLEIEWIYLVQQLYRV